MRHQIHICSVATRSGEPHNALHSSSYNTCMYMYTYACTLHRSTCVLHRPALMRSAAIYTTCTCMYTYICVHVHGDFVYMYMYVPYTRVACAFLTIITANFIGVHVWMHYMYIYSMYMYVAAYCIHAHNHIQCICVHVLYLDRE